MWVELEQCQKYQLPMVIWGMVYYCYTHITMFVGGWYHIKEQFKQYGWFIFNFYLTNQS